MKSSRNGKSCWHSKYITNHIHVSFRHSNKSCRCFAILLYPKSRLWLHQYPVRDRSNTFIPLQTDLQTEKNILERAVEITSFLHLIEKVEGDLRKVLHKARGRVSALTPISKVLVTAERCLSCCWSQQAGVWCVYSAVTDCPRRLSTLIEQIEVFHFLGIIESK